MASWQLICPIIPSPARIRHYLHFKSYQMNVPDRIVSRFTIASGVIGIVAFVSLIGFLVLRSGDAQNENLPIRVHDVCVMLQFLFLIPLVIAISQPIREPSPHKSKAMLYVGVAALCLTALFLLLVFPKILADTLYMFPQGIFGGWLMTACWRMKGLFPRWLRWFGMIVGFGLILVGIFPVGYALFVDDIILQIPAPSDAVMNQIPVETPANLLLHRFLMIGSVLGVLTLPVWTILAAVNFLRKSRSI